MGQAAASPPALSITLPALIGRLFFFCHLPDFFHSSFHIFHCLTCGKFIGYQGQQDFHLFICHVLFHTFSFLCLPSYLLKGYPLTVFIIPPNRWYCKRNQKKVANNMRFSMYDFLSISLSIFHLLELAYGVNTTFTPPVHPCTPLLCRQKYSFLHAGSNSLLYYICSFPSYPFPFLRTGRYM
nr:MAG TPA: hypothetical protein [Myoviridae sp. ctEXz2]